MAKESEQNLQQLQMYEQSLQTILMQKQQFQSQLTEIGSALKELDTSKESYKIIGNIMVSTDKDALKKELEEQKTKAELRINTLEKQESTIKDKAEKLQKEVMESMKE